VGLQQQVNVGRRATGGKQRDFLVASDHRKLAPQRLGIADKVGALLGAEDTMHENRCMGVRHCWTITWILQSATQRCALGYPEPPFGLSSLQRLRRWQIQR